MKRNYYGYLVAILTLVLSCLVLLTKSQNLTYSESFESGFTIGSKIGSNADWYDGGNGPVITSGNGVAGSVGLAAASNIFSWTAHPFNWNDADFLGVILQMDFETDGSGHFDDDRLGWSLYNNSVSSDEIFSVQLDPGGSGYNIEGYWLNASNTKVYPSMVSLPTLPGNTWYRFRAEITKLTATSASIDVSLTQLDGSGNPTGTPITGSIANTADLGTNAPNSKYFPSGDIWANYKNYTSAAAPADNAYLEIVKAATGPEIIVTGIPLNPFTSVAGSPSAEQSYSVSGSNLTEDITITAPADFEISVTSGSGFGSTVILAESGGTVSTTPIYVRFNRSTSGTSTGDITHTSAGVTTENVAVSGTATEPSATNWIAYNDCVYRSSDQYIGSNVTQFGIGNNFTGSTTGELINQADATVTGVTVTLTESGGVVWQPDPANGGSDCAAGTDAYNTFSGLADMTGVIYYGPSAGWYVDLTFTGLDPTKNYTFVTSASRGNASYTDRYSIYSILNADSYTNESSAGVNVIDESSVYFNTGDNYNEGYVAKWSNITAADGSFTVRATHHPSASGGYKAYAFDAFMLEEFGASPDPFISITGIPLNPFTH